MCPGELQYFTCKCETRASRILAWEIQSDQYIGRGNRLTFLSAEQVGTKKCSEINPGVCANLTIKHFQNGVQVLTSVLTISDIDVMYHPDTIQVTCVNVGLSTEDSYGLTVGNCMSTIVVHN